MKKWILFICLLCGLGLGAEEAPSRTVLVSVAPYKYFLEKIAGGTLKPVVLVPPGVSAHTYEPTLKQAVAVHGADIWFQIGDPFELRASPALRSANPNMRLIDLRDGVELITVDTSGSNCSYHGSVDPHVWLSPKAAKVQARVMAKALVERYPEYKESYQKNLELFLQELDALDRDVRETIGHMANKSILVSHPAYSYLARDYGLEQLALECEGKDPTPQQLTRVIQQARGKGIKTVFVQEMLNAKGSKIVAGSLGGTTVSQDPYREDYADNLREIVREFSNQGPLK